MRLLSWGFVVRTAGIVLVLAALDLDTLPAIAFAAGLILILVGMEMD
jgi:hypothetical protein